MEKTILLLRFFCVPQQYMYKVKDCRIESITSDHAPALLTVNLEKEPSFKYWRLNASLLSDPDVVQEIQQCIKEYFDINDNGEVTQSILWEGSKAVIRGKIIEISSRLKKT